MAAASPSPSPMMSRPSGMSGMSGMPMPSSSAPTAPTAPSTPHEGPRPGAWPGPAGAARRYTGDVRYPWS